MAGIKFYPDSDAAHESAPKTKGRAVGEAPKTAKLPTIAAQKGAS
jgi:hypothetical protein